MLVIKAPTWLYLGKHCRHGNISLWQNVTIICLLSNKCEGVHYNEILAVWAHSEKNCWTKGSSTRLRAPVMKGIALTIQRAGSGLKWKSEYGTYSWRWHYGWGLVFDSSWSLIAVMKTRISWFNQVRRSVFSNLGSKWIPSIQLLMWGTGKDGQVVGSN